MLKTLQKALAPFATLGFFLGFATQSSLASQFITDAAAKRHMQVLEDLKKAVDAETTDAGKFTHFTRVMKGERSVELRRRILEMAIAIPGPDLEQFLIGVLADDTDAGHRGRAAANLGRLGSEKCLPALVHAAANDRTTMYMIGDVGGMSSARRSATFAIAELAARFPKLADKAVADLRALKPAENPDDNEGLADARRQALYQITHDASLLKPFFDRLQSKDATSREKGVVAFRFLKLKSAPPELIAVLKDKERGVRSWTALVLGEIGDPKTIPVLITAAGDPSEDRGVRANAVHSLGYMRAVPAVDLMRKLLQDQMPYSRCKPPLPSTESRARKYRSFRKDTMRIDTSFVPIWSRKQRILGLSIIACAGNPAPLSALGAR